MSNRDQAIFFLIGCTLLFVAAWIMSGVPLETIYHNAVHWIHARIWEK